MKTMISPHLRFLAAAAAVVLSGTVMAATQLVSGSINTAGSWSAGLPSNSNVGTITVDGSHTVSVFGFGGSSIVNHGAGVVTSTGTNGFNMGSGTWNMSGGKIISRYVVANGGTAVFNHSGGILELADVAGNQDIGVTNGGTMNISGTAVLDGTHASKALATSGTINFNTNWTGSWKWSFHTGNDWRNLFATNAGMRVNGASITEEVFDATFTVTDGGQTLSLTNPIQPTTFTGGEMLNGANWSSGLPVAPSHYGSTTVDGTYSDGNSPSADWNLTMTAGTISAAQNWHFSGNSKILVQGGTLGVTGDIRSTDDSTMTFEGGLVNWGGRFGPFGAVAGRIDIKGGTFTGTAGTTFGNSAGGIVTVSGGSITVSHLDFADGYTGSIGGSAVLSGDTATFGWLDVMANWTGSFTVAVFSGDDWENEFIAGNVSFAGTVIDHEVFAANFTVSNSGKTLAYTPSTGFLGGNILAAASWSNGLPRSLVPGLIAVDGSISTSLFGFGNGSVIQMSGGTLTSNGAEGFNFRMGGTWNMTGGKIVSRYFIANSEVATSVINISGGIVELADVEGNQDMGVANGGTLNISGTAVLDATQATKVLQTVGTINIASNWTGTWIYGFHSGSDWENLFLSGSIKLDGNVLDLAGFNANFTVSNNGKTLEIGSGGTPNPVSPSILPLGFNQAGEFEVKALNLSPLKTYILHSGTDLVTFPNLIGSPVTGVSQFLFIDTDPPSGKAFYRLDEQ